MSIGSDAVYAAEKFRASNSCDGSSSIEAISNKYGRQAVVISVDPKRQYVTAATDTTHTVIELDKPEGPNGEKFCWYACTVKGGREQRDIDAFELAVACEALGAGEILLNSIDQDGQKSGFDLKLVEAMKKAVTIPVIASSGAGAVEHFVELFEKTSVEAGLAAGIFHREEVTLGATKSAMIAADIPTRAGSPKPSEPAPGNREDGEAWCCGCVIC